MTDPNAPAEPGGPADGAGEDDGAPRRASYRLRRPQVHLRVEEWDALIVDCYRVVLGWARPTRQLAEQYRVDSHVVRDALAFVRRHRAALDRILGPHVPPPPAGDDDRTRAAGDDTGGADGT